MTEKVINIKTDDDYRIVAISDVHGNVDLVKRLINKIELTSQDYLVIIGDFINKGVNSLETCRYIMNLQKRDRTIVLKGNHEYFIHSFLEDIDRFEKFFLFLKENHYETLIHSFLAQHNKKIQDYDDYTELYNYIHLNYKEEVAFITNLPFMLVIDEFRFVHGGYEESYSLEEDEGKFLKFDDYNKNSKVNELTTVVGHWPLSNLRDNVLTNLPFFNDEKRIVFIDGAIGVKSSGELNGFIITKKKDKVNYSLVQENNFKKAKIIKEHEFDYEEPIYVNYPHYDFIVIERGTFMTKCKHVHSQKEFTVFNGLIEKDGDAYKLKTNYINNWFNLKLGDEVDVCMEFEDCVLIKYNDYFGWILKEQI